MEQSLEPYMDGGAEKISFDRPGTQLSSRPMTSRESRPATSSGARVKTPRTGVTRMSKATLGTWVRLSQVIKSTSHRDAGKEMVLIRKEE
jgi:hypothetical protein